LAHRPKHPASFSSIARHALFAALAIGLWLNAASAVGAEKFLGRDNIEITVYEPDGSQVIGHGRYVFHQQGRMVDVRGDVHYTDGSRDLEHDLVSEPPNSDPVLRLFRATFLAPDGSPLLVERANFRTGQASCKWASEGNDDYQATLQVPPDTYAGALAVMPLEEAFARGEQASSMHMFECMPKPAIVAVDAELQSDSHWRFHPGVVAHLQLFPDLGWLTTLASPFIPKVSVWLDPAAGWAYIGTLKARFYKGPEELMVRKLPDRPSPTLPGGPAPHPST